MNWDAIDPALPRFVQDMRVLLDEVDHPAEVYAALEQLGSYFNLDNFFFFASYPAPTGATTIITSNLPKQWCENYERLGYVEIDPAALHCRARLTPRLWWTESSSRPGSTNHRTAAFIEEARSCGLRSGASLPIHGFDGAWGMLSLSCDCELKRSRPRLEQSMPYVQLLSGYVFEAMIRAAAPKGAPVDQPPERDQQLSKREKECLIWCSEGKTAWEISKILGIAERTVCFHLTNATRKLGASNRLQAVTMAMPHLSPGVRWSPPRRVIRMWSKDQSLEENESAAN